MPNSKRTSDDFASPLLFKREVGPNKKKMKLNPVKTSKTPKIATTERLANLCRNIQEVPKHIGYQFKPSCTPQINFATLKTKLKCLGTESDAKTTEGKSWISYPLERTTGQPEVINLEQSYLQDKVKKETIYSKMERHTSNFHNLIIKNISKEDLKLQYVQLFPADLSNHILYTLENEVDYYSADLAKVKICGIWRDIPRKQVAHGDENLTYTFSGNTLPTKPWTDFLLQLKKVVSAVTHHDFNFVLINRYKDGSDHIGWHRDAEPDLDPDAPIASLSFGQPRDFILKHINTKQSKSEQKISVTLEHGSLLVMNAPTNQFWLHSLPIRKKSPNVRINLTFRKIIPKC